MSLTLKVAARCEDRKLVTDALKFYSWAEGLDIRDRALDWST